MASVKYRVPIFIASVLLVLGMTAQLFTIVNTLAMKLERGSTRDSGSLPKRPKNVNAWYVPDTSTENSAVTSAYPVQYPGNANNVPGPASAQGQVTGYPNNKSPTNGIARIVLANTTACPIFRAQDNGSTNPPLIS
jgi:hypothetical protein